jgi:signal transduction histidine kinase/ActR/RegA family two-component response regulator
MRYQLHLPCDGLPENHQKWAFAVLAAMISDSFFSAAFHGSPIGQCLLAPTDRLEIIAVNDAFLRSAARRREDVLGMPLFAAFGSDPDDPADTGMRDLARSIRTAIATGQSQKMPAQRYPVRMEQEGRAWFQDMYWSATNTPVYDAQGMLLCVSHTTIDVTAQVLAEQALRMSREEAVRLAQGAEAERAYLAGVLRAAPVGILVVDNNLKVLHRNPAHEVMFGAALPQADGRLDMPQWSGRFIDGEHAGRAVEANEWPLRRAANGETVDRCLLEVTSFMPERHSRMLMVSAAPIRDSRGGGVRGAVAVSVDIEPRVRAEEALREADRRKDEFLAMLAHELRNPLAPIGAAAALLAKEGANADHVRRSSAVISRQVQHMTGLINELLDVARVTRGLITLDKTELDTRRVAAEALEQVRPVLEARHHRLRVSQPPIPALVSGDHKRLVQVLANLLNNAAKFTPEGGTIELALAIDPRHVRMTVADSGVGMAPALIDRAFELFTQAERTADRAQGGLGIGLALVRSLVALHGGHVTAESAGPGHGSRFTICLPRLDVGKVPSATPAPGLLHATQNPLKLLVVDDNEDGLLVLEMLLAAMGHQVNSTSRPTEVMRRAHAWRPDVCLLDIGLPDIDGLTLARMLRADPLTRDMALLAMSGYGRESDRAAALTAGFDRYFVKPVDAGELARVLAEIGQRRHGPG